MRSSLLTLVAAFSVAGLMLNQSAEAAYYSVLDTGEIMSSGNYKLAPDLQILTDDGGLNLGVTGDMGIDDEFGLRALAGFGKTDFYFGGMLKWVPVPDIEGQPLIGMNVGLIYAKDNDIRDMLIRAEPILSKKISLNGSALTPYVALPMSVRLRNSSNPKVDEDTVIAWQLVGGAQLQVEQLKKVQFMAEVGVELNEAPSYVAGSMIFYVDEEGFAFE